MILLPSFAVSAVSYHEPAVATMAKTDEFNTIFFYVSEVPNIVTDAYFVVGIVLEVFVRSTATLDRVSND